MARTKVMVDDPEGPDPRMLVEQIAAAFGGRPLEGLGLCAQLQAWLDATEAALAAECRELVEYGWWGDKRARFTWTEIGKALGISQSAAHRRFG